MMKMTEIWRDIKDYEGLYQVSNFGSVKSLNYNHTGKEKILSTGKVSGGYLSVQLYKNGKGKMYSVHRLVAQAFIPNPLNLPQVNHKDENPSNNHVDNLEWCDQKYNNNYGTRLQKVSDIFKGKNNTVHSKPVLQIDIETNEVIKEWPSMGEVERQLGIFYQNISCCCRGKYKQAGGYKWKYKEAI